MKFEYRLFVAVSAVTLATLGGAFATVSYAVNAYEERLLDRELTLEARREARENRSLPGPRPLISDHPGPVVELVALDKHGVVYGPHGEILASTPSFRGHELPYRRLVRSEGKCFDLWAFGQLLRAVVVQIPDRSGAHLLLAAPRVFLDGEAAFLRRAMWLTFLVAVGWCVLVATWVSRRLTSDHRHIAEVARRVAGGDLTARVAPLQDVPDVAELARDINEMIARLAELVNSQQQFIAHAAHELRSPLTTLYGELSLALRRPREVSEYRRAIEEALDSTRRLKALAEDLLALARVGQDVERAPLERLELSELWESAKLLVDAEARERNVTITTQGEGGSVRGRRSDLERLLRNVLENAVRHAPEGTAVEQRTSRRNGKLVLTVRDFGKGVAEKDRPRIFEPFYRGGLERAEGGTGAGLGLSIAREIARKHGGELQCIQLPSGEKGALFEIELPLG